MKVFRALTLLSLIFVGACNSESSTEQSWKRTIQKVSSGVVTIQVDLPVTFDGLYNISTQATGFVVDAERGIVLTNRHVMTPGPGIARAIFNNSEEANLTPLYFDPVHDFAFYQYDARDLDFIEPHAFKLAPELAKVGTEIRVIGNDDAQKLSIHSGTLSRTDRNAPQYAYWGYKDFNTFYIQASSGTKGGSSGSPVIDVGGQVLALNAGGAIRSNNAFYLPITLAKRTLEALQSNESIARGSLQSIFVAQPFDELKRLGLSGDYISSVKSDFPDIDQLLVVDYILPESPASEHLKVGDILISINREFVTHFDEIEMHLSQNVGGSVEVSVNRMGVELTQSMAVSDLHDTYPNAYLENDFGLFHDLSFLQAMYYNRGMKGVQISRSPRWLAKVGVPDFSIVTHIDGKSIESVSMLVETLKGKQEHAKVHVRYRTRQDPLRDLVVVADFIGRWHRNRFCSRSQTPDSWRCDFLETQAADEGQFLVDASAAVHANRDIEFHNRFLPDELKPLTSSLVTLKVTTPYPVNNLNYWNSNWIGTGVIVDAERGRIITDRSTAASVLSDVRINFFNSVEVPGRVEYVHPIHSVTVISYDPALVASLPIKEVAFAKQAAKVGESVYQTGRGRKDGIVKYRSTKVESIEPVELVQDFTPRYREHNINAYRLSSTMSELNGPIMDEQGAMVAFYAILQDGEKGWEDAGIRADIIREALEAERDDAVIYSAEVELREISILQTRNLGLDDATLEQMRSDGKLQNKLLQVIATKGNNKNGLINGDIVLSENGEWLTSFRDFELATNKPESDLSVLRNGAIINVAHQATALTGYDIERLIMWQGMILHTPHREALTQKQVPAAGLWVSTNWFGSPSSRYRIGPTGRIIEAEGQTIQGIDDFLALVGDKKHQESVRLTVVYLNNYKDVVTLHLDKKNWPTTEIKRDGDGWDIIHSPFLD